MWMAWVADPAVGSITRWFISADCSVLTLKSVDAIGCVPSLLEWMAWFIKSWMQSFSIFCTKPPAFFTTLSSPTWLAGHTGFTTCTNIILYSTFSLDHSKDMLYMVSSENVLLRFPVSMNRKELGKCTTHLHNKMPPPPPLVSLIYLNLQSVSTAVRPAAHILMLPLPILQLTWKTAATQRSQIWTAGKESCERVACKVFVQHECACCPE